jgi:hypothetical protein
MKKKTKSKWPIKTTETSKVISFWNNVGDRRDIPEDYTLADLIAMGVTEIRVVKKGSFLPDGWYSNEKSKERKTK